MKLIERIWKKKMPKSIDPASAVRGEHALQDQNADSGKNRLPQPQKERWACSDGRHDFIRPYPFRCRKCGLSCTCREEEISKYMGSFFDGSTYQWNVRLRWGRIAAFSLSTGVRPVYSVECDFSRLRVQRCLRSKDGWLQSRFPADYFTPREIELCRADGLKLKRFLKHCNFSSWETPGHYAKNRIMGANGFHVDKMFTCQFTNGRRFICLKPEREEFEQLVSLVKEITGKGLWEPDRT